MLSYYPHMSAHHNTSQKEYWVKLEIGIRLTAQCARHMLWLPTTEAQTPPVKGLDILAEDTVYADIDNDSTHNSDATVALGGPEIVEYPEDPAYDNQDKLTTIKREINDLHQRVAVGEGQPAETLDCIQHELQNLLIAIHQPQPPAPAEPLENILYQYTDILCSTQKHSNCTNSLIHDIPVFNEHDSTKLEDWPIDLEMAADLPVRAESGLQT